MTLTQIPLGQPLILTVFWTLCYELAFYVIVALFLQATRLAENTNLLFQSLNIFTILCLVWLIISPTNCPFPLNLWPQFGFGILVFNLIFQPKHHKPKIFLAISIVLMLLYGTLYSYGAKLGQPSSQIQSYFSVIYTILLLWLYQFDEKLILTPYIRPLASIGMFSYSLYLTHLITLGTLSQLGRKLGFSLEILFCLQIVSSLLVAYIFFRLFERPFLKTNSFNRRIAKSLEKS
jgi:peptidoglycan/LPS O-acetylase OafA/YrhL